MKNKLINKFRIIIIVFFLGTPLLAQQKFAKEINKEFAITDKHTLIIDNSFGDIDIKNWNKNSVSINVIITVEDRSEISANKTLEKINIDFSESRKRIIAKTDIENEIPNKTFHIKYKIFLPVDINIELNNSHGDISIEEIKGSSKIYSNHGNITINNLSNTDEEAIIDINYGIANIINCKKINITSKHAELIINNSKEAHSNNINSKLNFRNIGSLNIVSKYDSIKIGRIDNLIINAKNSFFDVNVLNSIIETSIVDVDLIIDCISESFKSIKITDGRASTISLGMSPQSYYSLNVSTTFSSFKYKENANIKVLKHNHHNVYSGIVGEKRSELSKVEIISEHGNVSIN